MCCLVELQPLKDKPPSNSLSLTPRVQKTAAVWYLTSIPPSTCGEWRFSFVVVLPGPGTPLIQLGSQFCSIVYNLITQLITELTITNFIHIESYLRFNLIVCVTNSLTEHYATPCSLVSRVCCVYIYIYMYVIYVCMHVWSCMYVSDLM